MTRTPVRVRSLACSAAAVLALTLTACGGDEGEADDGGTDTGEAAISSEDFVEQANAICTAGNDELTAASEGLDQTDPEALAAFATDTVVPNITGQVDDIRALGFPEGDEDLLTGILDEADAALEEVSADPSLLAGAFADVNAQLIQYGLTECGA